MPRSSTRKLPYRSWRNLSTADREASYGKWVPKDNPLNSAPSELIRSRSPAPFNTRAYLLTLRKSNRASTRADSTREPKVVVPDTPATGEKDPTDVTPKSRIDTDTKEHETEVNSVKAASESRDWITFASNTDVPAAVTSDESSASSDSTNKDKTQTGEKEADLSTEKPQDCSLDWTPISERSVPLAARFPEGFISPNATDDKAKADPSPELRFGWDDHVQKTEAGSSKPTSQDNWAPFVPDTNVPAAEQSYVSFDSITDEKIQAELPPSMKPQDCSLDWKPLSERHVSAAGAAWMVSPGSSVPHTEMSSVTFGSDFIPESNATLFEMDSSKAASQGFSKEWTPFTPQSNAPHGIPLSPSFVSVDSTTEERIQADLLSEFQDESKANQVEPRDDPQDTQPTVPEKENEGEAQADTEPETPPHINSQELTPEPFLSPGVPLAGVEVELTACNIKDEPQEERKQDPPANSDFLSHDTDLLDQNAMLKTPTVLWSVSPVPLESSDPDLYKDRFLSDPNQVSDSQEDEEKQATESGDQATNEKEPVDLVVPSKVFGHPDHELIPSKFTSAVPVVDGKSKEDQLRDSYFSHSPKHSLGKKVLINNDVTVRFFQRSDDEWKKLFKEGHRNGSLPRDTIGCYSDPIKYDDMDFKQKDTFWEEKMRSVENGFDSWAKNVMDALEVNVDGVAVSLNVSESVKLCTSASDAGKDSSPVAAKRETEPSPKTQEDSTNSASFENLRELRLHCCRCVALADDDEADDIVASATPAGKEDPSATEKKASLSKTKQDKTSKRAQRPPFNSPKTVRMFESLQQPILEDSPTSRGVCTNDILSDASFPIVFPGLGMREVDTGEKNSPDASQRQKTGKGAKSPTSVASLLADQHSLHDNAGTMSPTHPDSMLWRNRAHHAPIVYTHRKSSSL